MKNSLYLLVLVFLSSCYNSLSIEDFDKDQWINYEKGCSTYRMEKAQLIVDNQDVLLKGTQNEIESILGKAVEHELYERNQKFFHYRLTPPDSCGEYETIKYLSVRFNAIGRANLVQIMLREPQ
ncbi:hypothetical protein [Ekhidna sp. To15]|uniref:hypothetical protein n=1 Tax=Ekhidna sp. To15 TaxID=3395267 RepID=UPI003F52862D